MTDPLARLNGFGGTKNFLHQPTIRGSIPGKSKKLLSAQVPRAALGSAHPPIHCLLRGSLPGGLKQPSSEDNRSSRPSAHVKNKWSRSYIPHLPM